MRSGTSGDRRKLPGWRKGLLIVGAVVVYLVAFDRLQHLLPASRPTGEAAESTPPEAAEPVRPTVTRTPDGVEVSIGLHRTTVRLGQDEAAIDELVACIEDGFDLEGDGGGLPGPESPGLVSKMMNDKENAERVNRIIGSCLSEDLDWPALPGRGS